MLGKIRSHLTYANVMATVAVFISLGGASYAAIKLPKNSVGTSQIKNNAVTDVKVKNGSLTGGDVKNKSLTAADFNGSVQGPQGPQGAKGDPGPATGPAGGDLTGNYPAPTIAAAAAPVPVADNPVGASDPCNSAAPTPMVLCGTSSKYWLNGGFGLPGLEVWRDRIGQVHVRGSVTLSTGTTTSAPTLLVFPADQRPKRLLAFPVATGDNAGGYQGGTAILLVYPDGLVALYSASAPTQRVVHVGDITFRTDA